MTLQTNKALLFTLHQRGVRLWVENGQLRFRAPRGTLSADDLMSLQAARDSLIDLIGQFECATDVPLQPRTAGCSIPLTGFQLQAWKYFTDQSPGMMDRKSYVAVRIVGSLSVDLLRRCLAKIISRHESLRTRIVVIDGTPRQQIDAAFEPHLEVVDLAEMPPPTAERYVMRLGEEFVREKISLSVGPLFAAKIFRLSGEHVLILASNELVSDAFSNNVLVREISTLYQQASQGLLLSLPRPLLQFPDYAVWQQQTYSHWLKMHGPYWMQRLTGAPQFRIPRDIEISETKDHIGAVLTIPFGSELSTRLREVARREGILPAVVALTVYVAVISRWCNCRDLVVVFVSNGRTRPELYDMVGFLASNLYLRIEVTSEDSFLSLLRRVECTLRSAYEHNDFDRVPLLIPECTTDLHFNWLPDGCTWAGSVDRPLKVTDELEIQPFSLEVIWRENFFYPLFHGVQGEVNLTVVFQADLFRRSTVEWFASSLVSFAEQFANDSFARIASASMVPKQRVDQPTQSN